MDEAPKITITLTVEQARDLRNLLAGERSYRFDEAYRQLDEVLFELWRP